MQKVDFSKFISPENSLKTPALNHNTLIKLATVTKYIKIRSKIIFMLFWQTGLLLIVSLSKIKKMVSIKVIIYCLQESSNATSVRP